MKEEKKKDEGGAPEITVVVHIPNEVTPISFTWPKTKKIGEAADEAAAKFGVPTNNTTTFQDETHRILDRNKPLVAEHVKEGSILDLVSNGGGV